MKRILFKHVLLLALTYFLVGCAGAMVKISEPGFVLVEQKDPAYIVFAGIPKDTDKAKLGEIRSKISGHEEIRLLSWEQFTTSVDRYVQSAVLINDYPNFQIVDGLICLLERTPGAPWGLTWNGGIALTRNDYEHAKRQYESYKENPDEYKAISDPRADPVNPGGHLPAFGCL
jgi:hypothetical protein